MRLAEEESLHLRTLEEARAERVSPYPDDGGAAQAMTACTHVLCFGVTCVGFGTHWVHSGNDEQGKWIFWTSNGKIFSAEVDSRHYKG